MMKVLLNGFTSAVLALLLTFNASAAIIKLDLAKTPAPDLGPAIEYVGSVLGTPLDGNGITTGDQDTAIVFGDFLSALPATRGSYSLHGLGANGPATTVFIPGPNITVVSQSLSGGSFQLYDSANVKLLDVSLASSNSVLSGTAGPASTTANVFSITNGTVVGGTLASQIASNTISFSFALTNISGGGLAVASNVLAPFTASATKEIAANPVPEPSAAVLIVLGSLWSLLRRRGKVRPRS
jgi:hypothetical protein